MPMLIPQALGAAAPMMKAGMSATKMAGGLGGMLGLSQGQGAALPGMMQMMGQGMQGGGGQQPQQRPAPPQAQNNPAAIQAAIQMMQRLKTQRGGFMPDQRHGGMQRPGGMLY